MAGRTIRVILTAAALLSQAPCTGAETAKPEPAGRSDGGVRKILLGWTEIPRCVAEVTRDSGNPLWGLACGTLKGAGRAIPITISGISETLSSGLCDSDRASVRPDELNRQLR
jgi:hypothetical protein